jgi:molybdenum cofactor cytidylyltransferase
MLSALILAGGDSTRMGRTKALLECGGRTFLDAVCAGVKSAGVKETVVILGASRKEVLAAWQPEKEKIALNETPELGQIASVRAGLALVGREAEAVMIALVDQPTIEPGTYKLIADFWRSNKDSIIIPKCRRVAPTEGLPPYKRGHPIVIPRKYFQLCFDGPADKGLHWVTHHTSAKVLDLVVEDAEIIRDFDTPEDYKDLKVNRQGR